MIPRRELLKGAVGSVAAAGLAAAGFSLPAAAQQARSTALPRKGDFDLTDGEAFLNAAFTHPIPRPSADATRAYLAHRSKLTLPRPGSGGGDGTGPSAKALFAELINASPTEVAYVANTSAAENLVVSALGLDRPTTSNVVTDWLHFEGALMHLLDLKRQGLDVRVVKPTADFRIDIRDLDRVIDRNTKLVELSSTAMYNGFQHDLKAVCDLAHSRGALVYADIIHSAGAEPFDVKASGVDFAACSTYKWLMGDYGLGFLYARGDLLERLRRPQVSYYQAASTTTREPPFGIAGAADPVEWTFKRSAAGYFETGTIAGALGVGLAASLGYIKEIGVANIQAHRQPLLKKLRDELPRLGFTCVTPPGSTGGVITFARAGLAASDIPAKLTRAKVNVRVATNWMRVSPSIYNDMADVDRLLNALA
jgi:selenocysteine lyase/cysteine desulfurase